MTASLKFNKPCKSPALDEFLFKGGFGISNFYITLSSKMHFLTEKLKIAKYQQLGSDFFQLRRYGHLSVLPIRKYCN